MTKRFVLSPRAKHDLKSFKAGSLREWGPELTNAYLGIIESRLVWLAEKPALGKPRDEIRKGLKVSLKVGM